MKNSYIKNKFAFSCYKKFYKKIKIIISLLIAIFGNILIKILKYNLKICLCIIAKDENLYAREFVEYYKKIGYNKIFLYDNNEKYGEHFEEVINDYIKNKFVQLIDFRGIRSKHPQHYAYKDCYEKNNKFYNWLSFFDMDEYLEINKKYSSIQDFFKDKIFKSCENIKINWLIYINNNSLYYENISLQERMKRTAKKNILPNIHIKSSVRGNLSMNYWKRMANPHTSTLNYISCDSSGKKINPISPFNKPPDYTNALIRHYYYKSFEEFCLKIKRGLADHSKKFNKIYVKKRYEQLYLENKNNEEKVKIMNKIFANLISSSK